MMAHSIVYIVLSLLSLVAVHALGAPSNEPRQEQHAADAEAEKTDRKSTDTL